MKRIVYLGLAILVVCALLVSGACAPKTVEKATLKIGAPLPMTGPAALWGEIFSAVTQIYVDLLNSDGGVLIGNTKYDVEFFVEDDEYTPEGTADAAVKLFDVHGVNAVCGQWSTPLVATTANAATERNKVYIASWVYFPVPGSEAVLGSNNPTTFAVCHNNEAFTQVFIPYVAQLTNSKTLAILLDDYDIPRWLGSQCEKYAAQWEQEYGFKMVYTDYVPIGTTDFSPWLLQIAALPEKVDAIVGDLMPPNLAMVAKQGYEINPEWSYGSWCFLTDAKDFVEMVGYDAAQGCYTSTGGPWDFEGVPAEYLDMAERIRDEYKVRYGKDIMPGSFVWLPQEVAVYIEGCKQAGSIETEAVVQALETKEIKDFYGIHKTGAGGEKTFGLKRFFSRGGVVIGKIEGYELKAEYFSELPDVP